jgi:hypothetical protein
MSQNPIAQVMNELSSRIHDLETRLIEIEARSDILPAAGSHT